MLSAEPEGTGDETAGIYRLWWCSGGADWWRRRAFPAIPVVGYLGLTSAEADAYLLAPFRKGLSEAGFDEGRNVSIDYRFAERDVSRLPALAAELVRRKVTAIFTGTTFASP